MNVPQLQMIKLRAIRSRTTQEYLSYVQDETDRSNSFVGFKSQSEYCP